MPVLPPELEAALAMIPIPGIKGFVEQMMAGQEAQAKALDDKIKKLEKQIGLLSDIGLKHETAINELKKRLAIGLPLSAVR